MVVAVQWVMHAQIQPIQTVLKKWLWRISKDITLRTGNLSRLLHQKLINEKNCWLTFVVCIFRAPFGLFYHAAWFTQPHHKEGFIKFLDTINSMNDVWIVTNWQALQWVRDPTPLSRMNSFQPFHCNYQDRPKRCNNPKVCNLWHKSGVRYMRTCQPCPDR